MNNWDPITQLDEQASESAVPSDDVLQQLADEQTRQTLYYLQQREQSATLDEITDSLTGQIAAADERIVTPDERERLTVRLYHSVLPKLDRLGYLEFDASEQTVAEITVPAHVSAFLSATSGKESPS